MSLTRISVICLGAVFLILFALYGNYPILTGDSGTYINSGFTLNVPVDRPIIYGLFLRLFSLGQSLWLATFAQGLILAFLIVQFVVGRIKNISPTHLLLLLLFVSIATIAGWHASQIMPDIFTPILFLALFNYFFNEQSRFSKAAYLMLIFVSVMMHNSHLIIFTLCCLLLILFLFNGKYKFFRKKILALLLLCPASWLSMSSVNYLGGHGLTPSPASHVFLMGKLVETGF